MTEYEIELKVDLESTIEKLINDFELVHGKKIKLLKHAVIADEPSGKRFHAVITEYDA